jgi:hypothetical protein
MTDTILERLEPRTLLAATNLPTVLDPTFGFRGVFPTHEDSFTNDPFGFSTSYDTAAAAFLPDGRIAQVYHTYSFDNAAQEAFNHVNLELVDPDGATPAVFFDTTDPRVPNLYNVNLAAQSDGKIIVAALDDNRFVVARFVATGESQGGLDPTFGDNGIATVTFPGIYTPDIRRPRILIDSAGRIVVVADTANEGLFRLLIAHLRPPASSTSHFSGDGKSMTPPTTGEPETDRGPERRPHRHRRQRPRRLGPAHRPVPSPLRPRRCAR